MGLGDWIGAAVADAVHAANEATGAHETKVDEEIIANVRDRLNDCVDLFAGHAFDNAKITHASFGASPDGQELGTHHTRAQDVVQETLKGIVDDLTAFSRNVRKAADLVKDADTGAKVSLNAQQAVVDNLTTSATGSHADDAYNQARNNHGYHQHYHPHHAHPHHHTTSGGK